MSAVASVAVPERHTDHKAVTAVVHCRLHAITHRAGSCELRYLACATSDLQPVAAAATRSAVAPR